MNPLRAQHEIEGARASEWGLVVQLRNTTKGIVVPWTFTERLAHACREDREAFRVIGTHHVRWDEIDEDLHVDDLYAWAEAQEDGSLPFFTVEPTETRAKTTAPDASASIDPMTPEGVQSGPFEEAVERSAGAADIYLDPQSWDVLRDTLDELRSDDPTGVAAFEGALLQGEPLHVPRADALRDALLHEEAEQLVLEAAGRLTRALARAMGLTSGVALLARILAAAPDVEDVLPRHP